MTGKDILVSHHTTTGALKTTLVDTLILAQQIDAALASETARCAQIVWECRGKCVSDESARALMAEVRRAR
jgi:hypothetical protein